MKKAITSQPGKEYTHLIVSVSRDIPCHFVDEAILPDGGDRHVDSAKDPCETKVWMKPTLSLHKCKRNT